VRVGGKRIDGRVPLAPGVLAQLGSVAVTLQHVGPSSLSAFFARGNNSETLGAERTAVLEGAAGQLVSLIDRVANANINVLLLGETGVGKDVFAELVHRRSRRASRPFLRLHCAAIAESLFESELFGHEKGAFTGATQSRRGLLESAHGGTAFLDEIGELPPSIQVKLLRVLEDRRVTPVGSSESRKVDVRFVSATNRDLLAEARRGAFRMDLYYRLAGMVLTVPPLRERRVEIAPLARQFIASMCREQGFAVIPLGSDALAALVDHPFEGNIRELRNIVERGVLLAASAVPAAAELTREHLFPEAAPLAVEAEAPAKAAVDSAEAREIVDALTRCAGNQTEAAKLLGIARRTLINRIEKLGIPRPRKG
jgi:DNA-binding NtrC family response regulator